MLNVTGRLCVVVGAGAVGRRKAAGLLAAGAAVRLVDPLPAEVPPGVEALAGAYDPAQLDGAALVFACTDDADLNRRIAADARAAGALVNAADQPDDCDFFAPAVVADGDVVVAIGTGGSSPGLAGALKRAVAAAVPERIGEFAAALRALRERLRASVDDPGRRTAILKRLSGPEGHAAFVAGGIEGMMRLAEIDAAPE